MLCLYANKMQIIKTYSMKRSAVLSSSGLPWALYPKANSEPWCPTSLWMLYVSIAECSQSQGYYVLECTTRPMILKNNNNNNNHDDDDDNDNHKCMCEHKLAMASVRQKRGEVIQMV
jgi:hypothetical protein